MAVRTWLGTRFGMYNESMDWDTGVPQDGDSVVMDNAANCTMVSDELDVELVGFDMEGYTGTFAMGSNGIDVDGPVTLDGTITGSGAKIECLGTLVKTPAMTALPAGLNIVLNGTGDVTCNSVTGGDLTVSGTNHDATDEGFWDAFEVTAGIFDCNDNVQTVSGGSAGHLIRTGGSIDDTDGADGGRWVFAGVGNIKNASSSNKFYTLTITGTATTAGDVYLEELGGDGSISGSHALHFPWPHDNFYNFTGTCAVNIKIYASFSMTTGGAITTVNKYLYWYASEGNTVTMDGDLNLGTGLLYIYGNVGAASCNLDMNGNNLTCGQIRLGKTSGDRSGRLYLGEGTHSIASLGPGNSTNPENALFFETSETALSGTLDAGTGETPIVCTGPAAGSGTHPTINGGTVQNVEMPLDDEALDCTDNATDGGGNDNVWFSGTPGIHTPLGGGMIGAGAAV